jgi:polyisoprenoid-binding protein YceI
MASTRHRGFLTAPRIIGPSAAAAVVFTALSVMPADARRYEFDQRRTEVRFFYIMANAKHQGTFSKITGTLDYDEKTPEKSRIQATIVAASLSTGEVIVDNELKSEGFFNVEQAPIIAFKSMSVKSKSPTTGDVIGEITVNGITKPVMLKVTIEPHDDPALKYDTGSRRFIGRTRIDRKAFNMNGWKALVDDAVDIEINAVVRPR